MASLTGMTPPRAYEWFAHHHSPPPPVSPQTSPRITGKMPSSYITMHNAAAAAASSPSVVVLEQRDDERRIEYLDLTGYPSDDYNYDQSGSAAVPALNPTNTHTTSEEDDNDADDDDESATDNSDNETEDDAEDDNVMNKNVQPAAVVSATKPISATKNRPNNNKEDTGHKVDFWKMPQGVRWWSSPPETRVSTGLRSNSDEPANDDEEEEEEAEDTSSDQDADDEEDTDIRDGCIDLTEVSDDDEGEDRHEIATRAAARGYDLTVLSEEEEENFVLFSSASNSSYGSANDPIFVDDMGIIPTTTTTTTAAPFVDLIRVSSSCVNESGRIRLVDLTHVILDDEDDARQDYDEQDDDDDDDIDVFDQEAKWALTVPRSHESFTGLQGTQAGKTKGISRSSFPSLSHDWMTPSHKTGASLRSSSSCTMEGLKKGLQDLLLRDWKHDCGDDKRTPQERAAVARRKEEELVKGLQGLLLREWNQGAKKMTSDSDGEEAMEGGDESTVEEEVVKSLASAISKAQLKGRDKYKSNDDMIEDLMQEELFSEFYEIVEEKLRNDKQETASLRAKRAHGDEDSEPSTDGATNTDGYTTDDSESSDDGTAQGSTRTHETAGTSTTNGDASTGAQSVSELRAEQIRATALALVNLLWNNPHKGQAPTTKQQSEEAASLNKNRKDKKKLLVVSKDDTAQARPMSARSVSTAPTSMTSGVTSDADEQDDYSPAACRLCITESQSRNKKPQETTNDGAQSVDMSPFGTVMSIFHCTPRSFEPEVVVEQPASLTKSCRSESFGDQQPADKAAKGPDKVARKKRKDGKRRNSKKDKKAKRKKNKNTKDNKTRRGRSRNRDRGRVRKRSASVANAAIVTWKRVVTSTKLSVKNWGKRDVALFSPSSSCSAGDSERRARNKLMSDDRYADIGANGSVHKFNWPKYARDEFNDYDEYDSEDDIQIIRQVSSRASASAELAALSREENMSFVDDEDEHLPPFLKKNDIYHQGRSSSGSSDSGDGFDASMYFTEDHAKLLDDANVPTTTEPLEDYHNSPPQNNIEGKLEKEKLPWVCVASAKASLAVKSRMKQFTTSNCFPSASDTILCTKNADKSRGSKDNAIDEYCACINCLPTDCCGAHALETVYYKERTTETPSPSPGEQTPPWLERYFMSQPMTELGVSSSRKKDNDERSNSKSPTNQKLQGESKGNPKKDPEGAASYDQDDPADYSAMFAPESEKHMDDLDFEYSDSGMETWSLGTGGTAAVASSKAEQNRNEQPTRKPNPLKRLFGRTRKHAPQGEQEQPRPISQHSILSDSTTSTNDNGDEEMSSLSTSSRGRRNNGNTPSSTLDRGRLELLVSDLMSHQHGYIFSAPVDLHEFPDYLDVIEKPIDFSCILKKLIRGGYPTLLEFHSDMNLVFENAQRYNAPGSAVHGMATEMKSLFETQFLELLDKLEAELLEI